ncbi:acyltransferase domain-containing protein [Streptomyces lydicamycinicus]|uniref:acyltransferase domain-containing protein n=1 Tax=Streptomyces lydicamycinicus TaxID=1546107 RepID=UPI002034F6D9|nr:acyltransferase domain-containing protein [Streptomyces lydicamycinicus]USA05061.1 acyltransferase domain-containing protein [Streptomyces lydicamycinicus]
MDSLAVGRLLARALDELGVTPDLLTGHSLGEWTAMVVAGMYPPQAVDAFLDSLRPGSLAVPDLVYAALGCGAPQAAAALAGLERIAVSHDNCPHQSVICGAPEPLAEAVRRLAGQGVRAQEMPFRSGFHTPMWAPYLHQTGTAFDALPLRDQRLPVWSATTAAPFPDGPSAIRRLVLRHLLEPVRFQELTRRLYETGVRAFVQAGAGSLTGFVSDTLHGQDHLAVAAADSRRDGPAQLRRLAAALWTEGLNPRWDRLTVPPRGTGMVTVGAVGRARDRAPDGESGPRGPGARPALRAGPRIAFRAGARIVLRAGARTGLRAGPRSTPRTGPGTAPRTGAWTALWTARRAASRSRREPVRRYGSTSTRRWSASAG